MHIMQNRHFGRNNFQRRTNRAGQTKTELVSAIRAIQFSQKQKDTQIRSAYISRFRFEDFPISAVLKKNILDRQYHSPTPIQDQAIPAILAGQDIIGIANTGTGKTLAFLIPLIDKVLKNRTEKVFIITPTRELALQINQELQFFVKGMGIHSALCIGGMNIKRQENELRRNPNFVVGTPGRIKDLMQQKVLSLSQFHSVVLDETDRMVDIGFIDDIKYFISFLPRERQSLFFSATVSPKVQEIIRAFVHQATTISVKQQDTAETIDHDIVKIENGQKKIDKLHDLLIQGEFKKVLIFGRTKWGIQKLAGELTKRGFKVGAIHGNKRQSQRLRTLEQFKRSEINILLATDVASRGLDIEDISHVINYDIPATYEDYIHRIGRTGRVDKKGVALTFIE